MPRSRWLACPCCGLARMGLWLNDWNEYPHTAGSVPSWITREYTNPCSDMTSRVIVTAFGPDHSELYKRLRIASGRDCPKKGGVHAYSKRDRH